MKKRGLFIAFEFNYNADLLKKGSYDGIEKKIYHQINTFKNYGYDMDFCNPYRNRKHSIERIFRRLPFHCFERWDFNFDKVKKYDFIYIRKIWFMDGDLIFFLKKVKKIKPDIRIILEIPTYPYDQEGKQIDMIPLKIKDKFWRTRLSLYVDRVVTYSKDDIIFNIETIKTSNAIDYESAKRTGNDLCNDKINMIACGNLYYWHGFDRAIEGLRLYYNKGCKKEINLYIVGYGNENEKYEKMIKEYNLSKHVFLVGAAYGNELDSIYSKCVVGLDSMGRHRSGVFYNSSLKGKEYCAKGLIIISGVETELDGKSDYKFYYRVPATDEAIDFEDFLSYYNKLICDSSIEKIQKEIMSFAENNFDFSVVMDPIRKYIENQNRR